MRKTIEANLINGNLILLEPCTLDDGDEVLVHVRVPKEAPSKASVEELDSVDKFVEIDVQSNEDEPSSPKGHPVLEIIARAKANMPKHLQPEDVPADAAKNYKHYLYSWPRERD